MIHAEALERRIAGPAHVFGAPVDAEIGSVFAALVAELGSEDDLVPPAHDGAAHETLVGERTVHVGGVEEGHPEVERPVDGVDALLLVAGAVELRHPHAAEAERRHAQALFA